MARKKEFWRGRKEDEARYRFRIRFTRPPGNGIWHGEKVSNWLNERLGRDGWRKYPEYWAGHGQYTYAIHLDDHTVIPDLLAFWQTQELTPSYNPVFQASLGPNMIGVVRNAVRQLQQHMVDEINKEQQQVTWTLGTCTILPNVWKGGWLCDRVERIRLLGEVDTLLSSLPAEGGALSVQIEDRQRGALEIGVAMLGDLKPPPTVTIEDLRLLLDGLDELPHPDYPNHRYTQRR